MKFKNRVLLVVAVACVFCTVGALLVAWRDAKDTGYTALIEKSQAVISRLEAVRSFVANQGMFEDLEERVTQEYPDGNVPDEVKSQLLNVVPIVGSMIVGGKEAEKENYRFKVVSEDPRNPNAAPSPKESEFLELFESNPNIKEEVFVNEAENEIWVMRPIRLSESEGCLVCHGEPSTSPWGNGKDVLGYQMEGWKDGDVHGMFKVVSDLNPVDEQVTSSMSHIGTWGFGILIICIIAALAFIRKPLALFGKMVGLLGKVKDGDLTTEVDIHSKDEIGVMGEALNETIKSMRSALESIGKESQTLAGSAEEMTSVSEQITSNASSTSEKAAQASESAALVNQNIDSVAAAAEEMSATIVEIAQSANDAARVAGLGVDTAAKANETVTKLGERSDEIGNVVNLISSVAEQTNLLALNATIEAARAGAAGKGFAVVANEVKELAKETAKATEDIVHRIEAIQEETKSAISSIQEFEKVTQQVNEISSTIAGAVEEQSATTSEISKSVSEAAQGSGEIAQGIADVAEMAENTAQGIKDTKQTIADLAHMASNLEELIKRFRY